jgi:hypothetical protein
MAFRHLAVLVLASVMLAAGAAGMFSRPAMAQDQGWSLRDLLFPRRSERAQPLNRFPAPPKAKKPRRSSPPQPAVVESPAPEKAPDARVVLVIGDFLAAGLAEGLENAFKENPEVRIVDRSSGSSGFVRDDYYDWPKEAGAVIASEKPAVVIAMLGSNDRQQMQVGETRETPRSDAWTKQYVARTQAFGKAIAASKVPFLWVGMPAFKSTKMTSDMLAFNDIYRSAAHDNGGEFIDIWDGFADENGAFVTTGPDINGQPVRLRSDDGINITKAGKRKLAFYAEKPLMKILGLSTPDAAGASHVPAGEPVKEPEAGAPPAAVDRTVPMLLSDPALDGGTELLGAAPAGNTGLRPGEERAVTETAPDTTHGRADDFSWPPQGSRQGQAAKVASPVETTTAISP